ncbi:MAG: response regulator transcription factor [Dehalococcoidales bacterium]|jgi:DNA-binding NarL/FixJ family response regulator|nr:response regulator transcription factor [Dehalococcoidales bacterium]
MSNISILLAEDHVITREGIRKLLEDEPGFVVVGETGNGDEAVRLADELKPDIIIMDIAMPILNGIEATKLIKTHNPGIAILVLSAYNDDEYVFALLKAGAAGYLMKNVSGDELVSAVRAVCKGEPVLDPSIARKVINYFTSPGEIQTVEKPSKQLSSRETAIIKLAATGMTNKDIANKLHLSNRTIEGHMRTIFNKLAVGSRTEAVLYGLQKGWFTLDELI